ncbi:autotransporter domain-containing protein [Termitidicoccus mucosus]|uniref:Autotransporter domain-containing protein n=1 Tax=Termitidicoccus mucosus TaxID=1184151 RepID=A0A178IH43_9BACT|nr:hypothetical protein AW736_19025 [Opitutaceae bacterium TSB47]
MTKINLPRPAGRLPGLTTALALAASSFLYYSLAAPCTAQDRTDNRRLFWTGSGGAVWDNSAASWMTTGSYLSYANRSGGATWVSCDALPSTAFLAGDVAIFDSFADTSYVWTGSSWRGSADDPTFGSTRTIEIASEGVTVSDVVVYAAATSEVGTSAASLNNNYIFTGGAITAAPARIDASDVQLTGTGVGLAAGSVTPTGRLIKIGSGNLTLSNTAANHFPGGIHLLQGTLSVTTTCALGDNNIITNYITTTGNTAEAKYGAYYGAKLLPQIMQPGGGILPAVVLSNNGQILSAAGSDPTLHFAETADGIDVTGDIFIASRLFTLQIDGTATATISGNIIGTANDYGSSGGTLIKTGAGTLVLSGTRNLFYGSAKNYSRVDEGRVVATSPTSLGTGAWQIAPGTTMEFRGVKGTVRQAFIGGGAIEITNGSDLTFDWRSGTLDGYDGMSGNGSWHPAKNELSNLTISGQSRFTALASGTYSEVLGGPNVAVTVSEASTLVIGREGLTARGSGATKIPMTYAILANRIDLTGGSTLVLNPSAYLSTGALVFPDTDTTSTITFGASGVSRLRVQESNVDPDDITTTSDIVRYVVPDGMKLTINEIPIPVAPGQSIPNDNSSSGWCREYVLVNQGANPLKDITLTLNALDALHDTLYSHLADELVDPVTRHSSAKKRKWVNEAWVRYISSQMDYDRTSITTPGVEGRVNGLVAGADALLPGRVLLGIHGTIADNTLDTTNDTSLSSKHKILGIHAAQRFGKFYLSAAADTGRASSTSYRNEAGNLIRGGWDTSYYTGAVQIGATFTPWQNTVLKPFAGLRYAKLKISGHHETGSNFSPMEVKAFDDASAQAAYGVAVGRKFKLFKREFAADLSLARKHTIRSPRETLTVRYYDSPTTPVTLERGDYYADLTAIGLNLRAALSKHTIVGLALDYETASTQNRTTASLLVGYTW